MNKEFLYQTYQTKPTKPNLPNQTYLTKSNMPKQAKHSQPSLLNQTNQTKPKLLVKAVDAWVRSAFGNVLFVFSEMSFLVFSQIIHFYSRRKKNNVDMKITSLA